MHRYDTCFRPIPPEVIFVQVAGNDTIIRATVLGSRQIEWSANSVAFFEMADFLVDAAIYNNELYILSQLSFRHFTINANPPIPMANLSVKSPVSLAFCRDQVLIISSGAIMEYPSSATMLSFNLPPLDCAVNSRFVAIVVPESVLTIFALNEGQSRFAIAATVDQHVPIISLALIADTVLCGTAEGELILLHIVPGFHAGEWEVDRSTILALGRPVSHLSSLESCVIGATDDGEIFQISLIPTTSLFLALMTHLSNSIRSLGDLNKSIEQNTRQARYVITNSKIIDLQVAFLFLSQSENDQSEALEDSPFMAQEAILCLLDVLQHCQPLQKF
jgi:hypothetical protein